MEGKKRVIRLREIIKQVIKEEINDTLPKTSAGQIGEFLVQPYNDGKEYVAKDMDGAIDQLNKMDIGQYYESFPQENS